MSTLLTARFPIATGKLLYSNGFAQLFFFPTQHTYRSRSSKFSKYQSISPAQFALQTSSCPLYPSSASPIMFVLAPVAAQNLASIIPAMGHCWSCPGRVSGLVLSPLLLRGDVGCSARPHTQPQVALPLTPCSEFPAIGNCFHGNPSLGKAGSRELVRKRCIHAVTLYIPVF